MTVVAVAEPKRDRWGRYMLPHPETGKEQAWTRVTTVANTLADRYGLEQWAKRNVALGIAAREDLYALAASVTPDDKAQLNKIVADAEEAAKARSGANLGTALHRITERVDRGEDLDIPDAWRADIDAYCQTLVDHHIKVHPEYMERIVVLPKPKVAGTLDRLVTVDRSDEYILADIKTGQDVVNYGMGEIAVQLALYANASHMWNGDGYDPMPPINKKRAIVIHLPVGQGRCDIHWVDIEAGAEAAKQALWVREWRKRKDLSRPFGHKEVNSAPEDDW